MNIVPKAGEREAGAFWEEHLANAVEAIREDGYVVIEQVVDQAYLNVLKERMDENSERLITAESGGERVGSAATYNRVHHRLRLFYVRMWW
jgi:ectoine hydroxylase-related dioxygenase (phytanoyl-CoA dioxygenase family)